MISIKNNSSLLLLYPNCTFYIAVAIVVAPVSVLVPLYTMVHFNCMGTGDVLSWNVGGNSLTDPSNQDREISVTTNNTSVDVWSSVLIIRALPINDGISVGCIVADYNFNFVSKGATLIIKG